MLSRTFPLALQIEVLIGLLAGMTVMSLQTSIVFGNLALDAFEMDEIHSLTTSTLIQECSFVDNSARPQECIQIFKDGGCQVAGGFTGFMRFYKPNTKIKPGLDAAVTFSVFLFLLHLSQLMCVYKWQYELASDSKQATGGLSSAAGAEPFSGPDSKESDGTFAAASPL